MTPRTSFLTALTLGMLALSSPGATARQAPEPRTIDVLAKRFTFEPATIEVAEGERIRLVVTSGDGVHGVEIKKFRVNKEIPRGGDPVVIEFTAGEAGRFPIICSAFCGDGHGDMKGLLVVVAREKDK
jgi:cytochrome c oxidase subunit 2